MLTARWHSFQQGSLRIAAYNRKRHEAVDRDIEFARRPIALLAHSYVTALGCEKGAARVVAGESALRFQPVRGIGLPVSHSSVIAQAPERLNGEKRRTRANALPLNDDDLLELFGKLISALEPQLSALRSLVVLPVQMVVSGNEFPLDVAGQWERAWASFGLGRYVLNEHSTEAGTMVLDAWLDETDRSRRERVALFVNVQLRDAPPEGSAEVATALLVAWPELLPRIGLKPTNWLHRPVRGLDAPDNKSLETALTWGRVASINNAHIWTCGLDTNSHLSLSAMQEHQNEKNNAEATGAIDAADIEKKLRSLTDIDTALGDAGHASSWLACALAAEAARDTSAPQLIATRDLTGTTYSVVRSTN
ncbi:hypothetical protein AWB74_01528 [Caballeronia arvi]|uniref:Uncharacterized protein n=1 Tax=Caballeronia arvi TaxID=1777135 RepID=A0A158H240_9BURK|nr:hypothetical protein [Caballeronia arvi]SAL38388.1 hypothetical protein AWB74_01528 [Caballeronia arvi]